MESLDFMSLDILPPAPVKISDNFPPAPVKISDNFTPAPYIATEYIFSSEK
jgi:hypothetical protein